MNETSTLTLPGGRPPVTLHAWPAGEALVGVDERGVLWSDPMRPRSGAAPVTVGAAPAREHDLWILDAVRFLEAGGALPPGSSWCVRGVDRQVVVYHGEPPPLDPVERGDALLRSLPAEGPTREAVERSGALFAERIADDAPLLDQVTIAPLLPREV